MRHKIVGVSTAILIAVALGVAPAHAKTVRKNCSAGGDSLSTTVYYDSDGSNWFVERNSFTLVDNSEDHNNVSMRLKNGSSTYFLWSSDDDIPGGATYSEAVDEAVPRAGSPNMRTNVVFDQSGGDPSCSTYAWLT